MIKNQIVIQDLVTIGGAVKHAEALDRIFFEASTIKSFGNDAVRHNFRERWLGRYIDDTASQAFVALDRDGKIVGYVVGALADPALDARFADIAYFRVFANETPKFPAHLHINVDSDARNTGIGARLITAFVEYARASGAPGLHIVTGAGMRNIGFYLKNGFSEIARGDVDNKTLVMLGIAL